MRKILLLLALAGGSMAFAQPLQLPSAPSELSDSVSTSVSVKSSSYFYNYEYFKNTAKGYTQPGFSLVPTLQLQLGNKLLLGAGAHLKKYWGTAPFGEVEPVVFARYEAAKNFFVQVGTLESSNGHLLSEVLYNPLHMVDYRQENGLQLRYFGSSVFAEAWVSWEHYIKEGDNDQEQLTAGGSLMFQLLPEQSSWELNVPVQLVFKHIGGQINDKTDPNKKVRTMSNLSLGLQLAYKLDSKGTRLGILVQPVKFNDSYDKKPVKGNSGNGAVATTLFYGSPSLDVRIGHLYSRNFYSILGDQVYNNITFDYSTIDDKRSMYSGALSYHKQAYRGVQFRFDTAAYYDPSYSDVDYYYGVGVIFDLSYRVR